MLMRKSCREGKRRNRLLDYRSDEGTSGQRREQEKEREEEEAYNVTFEGAPEREEWCSRAASTAVDDRSIPIASIPFDAKKIAS